jgi:hypothetical protein
MCEKIPADDSDPLLILKDNLVGPSTYVNIQFLQKMLRDILICLNIKGDYTLHSFRSGGASCTFHGGASVVDIQKQGTWKSQVFWKYIQPHPSTSSVPKVLKDISHI